METTYSIQAGGESIRICSLGRIELADNGKDGDANQCILFAIGDRLIPYLVLTANGDDSAVAWIDDDGTIEVMDDVEASWFASFGLADDADCREYLNGLAEQITSGKFASPAR